ncbi:MAG: serine--tRNA ligase [Candidatus Diapherotrites archaeon]|uniref:Serine--tRNA ligase n=1 Tax=Candidatus Iainarchaeum sp. TaxID=3101447 RepID=A0A8T4LDF5_9ARCH|nr:serine--tRNA ligase [Candidatus Diapherotrites archaeon]
MLDIHWVREHQGEVAENLVRRRDEKLKRSFSALIHHDEEWRRLKREIDDLRKRRNEISKEIDSLKRAGTDASQALAEAKAIPGRVQELEKAAAEHQQQSHRYSMHLPNLLDPTVPFGRDSTDNEVVKTWGKPSKSTGTLKPHGEFLQEAGLADFTRGTKISGAGFYFLLGELALLEQALARFALDFLAKKGFTVVQPPYMISRAAYEGVTDLVDFERVMYKVEGHDLFLIATSEHAICSMFRDEILEEDKLPIKLAGLSPCFRKEIGAHGVDTRGLFRVHQFNKVEQFVFCRPEDSPKIHAELLANAEALFQKLGLPYRVVLICTGDIGAVAAKKYDLEAWMPREQAYKEAISCSNCTSYQAVRSNIKFRKKGSLDKAYVHTLNSTAIATSRALRAIVENFTDEKGRIQIPKPLQAYMGGLTEIKPAKPL